jgi:hypothetical protein
MSYSRHKNAQQKYNKHKITHIKKPLVGNIPLNFLSNNLEEYSNNLEEYSKKPYYDANVYNKTLEYRQLFNHTRPLAIEKFYWQKCIGYKDDIVIYISMCVLRNGDVIYAFRADNCQDWILYAPLIPTRFNKYVKHNLIELFNKLS